MQSTHLFSLEIARDHDAIPVSGMSQHDPLEITVSRSEVWHNVPLDFDFPLMAFVTHKIASSVPFEAP